MMMMMMSLSSPKQKNIIEAYHHFSHGIALVAALLEDFDDTAEAFRRAVSPLAFKANITSSVRQKSSRVFIRVYKLSEDELCFSVIFSHLFSAFSRVFD